MYSASYARKFEVTNTKSSVTEINRCRVKSRHKATALFSNLVIRALSPQSKSRSPRPPAGTHSLLSVMLRHSPKQLTLNMQFAQTHTGPVLYAALIHVPII